MTRAARDYAVIYFEEPRQGDVVRPMLALRRVPQDVEIATPVLPRGARDPADAVRRLLDRHLQARGARDAGDLVAWYYTPMALDFSAHLSPEITVYDYMDELSAFLNPPPGLLDREERLFSMADVVFTGGRSLYAAKRGRHREVFLFPSSIDAAHFARARGETSDPGDQAGIAHPRIGFFGAIDERMDRDLVARAARECPEIQFVMLGPVVKIDPIDLPRAPNLHWLGAKTYDELPDYLAHWDAGWMPFALNEATRFISPTKTPEFLAAGLQVTSTAVVDVVRDYGAPGLVTVLPPAGGDIAAILRESLGSPPAGWHGRIKTHLAGRSWDRSWSEMARIIDLHRDSRVQPRGQKGASSGVPV